MKYLLILNDPPYGSERVYNALRLAHALPKQDDAAEITLFLMADAVIAGRVGQNTPDGYYNIERMLKRVLSSAGRVLLCGTCMDARGLSEDDTIQGTTRSTMAELAEATVNSDKVLVF